MSGKKTGLVLSHIFVESSEKTKFDWVEKALEKYKDLGVDFFSVLCGHGLKPPKSLSEQFDEIYWKEEILNREVGRGHPHFSVKGFEICKNAGCQKTLKTRAYDYIENVEIFSEHLAISEQTDLSKGIIGDLFMYGETQYLIDWWTKNPWDYSTNGLSNLYKNMPNNLPAEALFLSPEKLGWKTFEDNANTYWGHHKNYEWHGGGGIKKCQ